jgi:predicted metalloprotease with PDZ domain
MNKRAVGVLAALFALSSLPAAAAGGDPEELHVGGGRIGVQVQPMTPELREHFKAPPDRGLLVTRLEPGRPAEQAGVKVGDVIVEAGGEAQRRTWDLVRVVGRAPEGQKLRLRIVRDGKTRTVEVVPRGPATPWPDAQGISEWLERGMQMGSEELRHHLREIERRLEELEKQIDEQQQQRQGTDRT